jgi:hypothetical protein
VILSSSAALVRPRPPRCALLHHGHAQAGLSVDDLVIVGLPCCTVPLHSSHLARRTFTQTRTLLGLTAHLMDTHRRSTGDVGRMHRLAEKETSSTPASTVGRSGSSCRMAPPPARVDGSHGDDLSKCVQLQDSLLFAKRPSYAPLCIRFMRECPERANTELRQLPQSANLIVHGRACVMSHLAGLSPCRCACVRDAQRRRKRDFPKKVRCHKPEKRHIRRLFPRN